MRLLLARLAVGAIAGASATIVCHPIADADPFWHLTLGTAVLETGSRTVVETSTFDLVSPVCIVPEWLWGVSMVGLHALGGWEALGLLPIVLAILMAVGLSALGLHDRPKGDPSGYLVAATATACALSRFRARPETFALALLPAFLLLALRYREASSTHRRRLGLAAVFATLVWAQVHGSFVLAPVIFGLAQLAKPAFPDPAHGQARPSQSRANIFLVSEHRRTDLMTLLGLLATLLSSAYGWELAGYIFTHAEGDATRHVLDMQAPAWGSFDPSGSPYSAALLALFGLGFVAVLRARPPVCELALAGLGVCLAMTAVRFFSFAAILFVPLAARGASCLHHERTQTRTKAVLGLAAAALSCGLFAWVAEVTAKRWGPLGTLGLRGSAHPRMAANVLSALPEGTVALSVYPASAPLSYLTGGRVRTYVDGRTPLYFDDVSFGVSRDTFASRETFERVTRRFGASVAVVRRTEVACGFLRGTWSIVALDPVYATFSREALPPLTGIDPCGDAVLLPTACDPARHAVDRIAELGDPGFATVLAASLALACDKDAARAQGLLGAAATMPFGLDNPDLVPLSRRVRLRIADSTRNASEALAVLKDAVRDEDFGILEVVELGWLARDKPDALRELLDRAVRRLDDRTPPRLRALLAVTCVTVGDIPCATFHALRAAAAGRNETAPILDVLARTEEDPRIQRDAAAWRAILASSSSPPPVATMPTKAPQELAAWPVSTP